MSVEIAEGRSSLPGTYEQTVTPDHSFTQTHTYSDNPIPSSPLLQESRRHLPSANNPNIDRSSRASTIRISQTWEQIRANSPLKGEFHNTIDGVDGNETDTGAEESTLESQADEEEDEERIAQGESSQVTYSKLSKRADSILANAKRKLSVSFSRYYLWTSQN